MNTLLWVMLGVLGGFGLAAVGDMVSEEVRDRLDHLPHAILRLAAYRLDPAKRVTVYVDEWIPELTYILKGDEARPVTRLYHGMRFAFGILVAVRQIDRDLAQARISPDMPQAVPLADGQPSSFQPAVPADRSETVRSLHSPGPTVRSLLLGGQLRRLREEAGITTEQAAALLRCLPTKISRIEHGRSKAKERDIADLLSLYGVGVGEEREALLLLAREANVAGWWQASADILPYWTEPYLALEAAASLIREYDMQFVPGLLQTEDYARAVTRLGSYPTEAEIVRRAAARVAQQEILQRHSPPRLWAVVDENALHRYFGGRQIMRAQLRHLIDMCEHPAVTLQILPFSAGVHRAMGGGFTILRYVEPDLRDVVYVKQLMGALYLEEQTEIENYREVMEQVCLQAASAAKTKAILRACLADA